ncbi:FIST signal transduction protein [Natronobiforma cellulositropha]|uniref:FIST signal transduction protein n=1 Tax=Natronobiforma cellulositropha TaxID=1679076 RepID=UPI0021D583DB|nr:FIST N-terminal domain-containing protein [Natronobiforma cellulositropha]
MNTAIGTALEVASDGRAAGERAAAAALEQLPSERVDFCQVFCSVEYDYEATLDGIRSVIGAEPSLIGCSTASAFSESEVSNGAVAIALVASDTLTFVTGIGTGLRENVSRAVREAVAEFPSEVDGYPYLSAINLHDGLAGVGEELALVTQQKLGPTVSIVGGSAADDHLLEATHVFCDDVVAQDAVALALIASKERPIVSVRHGHEPLSEPVEVTRAEGSLVYELDGKPAFQVWKDAVRERVREELDVEIDDLEPGNQLLARLMCEFEFGIDQGERYKMRWPWIEADDDVLHFALDIPEGTVFRVMHGTADTQIESAREAARRAREKAEGTPMAGAFIYDCACRGIVLGEEFPAAVKVMADELDLPFVGFETYGEMCMGLGQFSGFHNTTTVVMLLPE